MSNATPADPAPVESLLRVKMRHKCRYWRSLRHLTDEQQAALEFWEEYLARNYWPEPKRQTDVSEPVQKM